MSSDTKPKQWVAMITYVRRRIVTVQAPTWEEAEFELANDLIVHELQEYEEEASRKVTREFTRSRSRRKSPSSSTEQSDYVA